EHHTAIGCNQLGDAGVTADGCERLHQGFERTAARAVVTRPEESDNAGLRWPGATIRSRLGASQAARSSSGGESASALRTSASATASLNSNRTSALERGRSRTSAIRASRYLTVLLWMWHCSA